MIERKKLYRFPWSKTDNPGGWIEVTDICDMQCPGCYRSQMEGHRDLKAVFKDIEDTVAMTNCDCITIAGGEPLAYPHLFKWSGSFGI
jgi:MoaA/NifB/PqqE/SkfB family radical SAM enzyme